MKRTNAVPFVFGEAPGGALERVRRVVVPGGISSKEKLLKLCADVLSFPDYFGFNWDAFDECLGDLSWLSEETVQFVHDGVPQLPARDLKAYLGSLATAVLNSRHNGRRVVVSFPLGSREVVMAAVELPVRSR